MILCRKSYEETVEQSAKVCESIAAVEPSCSCSPGALSHMWITCSIMSSRRDSIAIPSTAWYARFCRDELTWLGLG